MGKLVQVASFINEIQMSLVRNKMEQIGIETFIQDEHINALREFSAGNANGVKILVRQEDYERSINYLVEIGHYNAKDFEASCLEKFLNKLFWKS